MFLFKLQKIFNEEWVIALTTAASYKIMLFILLDIFFFYHYTFLFVKVKKLKNKSQCDELHDVSHLV